MKKSSRQKSRFKPLPVQELAYLYVQLARLEKSGIPTQEALTMLLTAKGETAQRAKRALSYLKRGKPLSEAGAQAGLFVGLDATLVKVADIGGTHTEVFRQLATFYEEKARRIRQIKSKLFLPMIVLLLAIFIQPAPALILGKITFLGYLGATAGFIIQLALLGFILWNLPSWLRYGFLKSFGMGRLLDKLQINMPYVGRWFIRRQVRNFMQALGLMLQAGLPIFEALPKAFDMVDNVILHERLHQIILHLQKGHTFAQALSEVEGLDPVAIQLMSTGEQAGSLADMMLHYVKLESEAISMHNDTLAAWIPRIVYALIVVWIAYGILSGGPLMSPVPNE
jgi:general secretion pathway protein F